MKKDIYIMRHGQTLFNLKNLVQGSCDSPLTPKGVKQAEIAGQWFKNNNIIFKKGNTSTSERAISTLEIAFPGLRYERYKGLKEWDFGSIEGDENSKYAFKWPYNDYLVQFGGESDQIFENRITNIINHIVRESDDDNILIVTHGMILKVFGDLYLEGSKFSEIKRIPNCCIFLFEFDTQTEKYLFKEIINHDYIGLEN